jgi:hypothetical protein
VVADETHLVLHAFDDRVNQGGVAENALTVLLGLLWINSQDFLPLIGLVEVALEQDDLQQVQQVYLHCVVLVVYTLLEGAQDGIDNETGDLVAGYGVCLEGLQYQLHELTG